MLMIKKVKITADSTCDLSAELLAKLDISLMPLYVNLGDRCCRDRIDVTPEEIFDFYNQTKTLAKTAAINPQEYADFFASFTKDGYEVIHFNISQDMSTCYQSALLAAQEMSGVYVVDSMNLSTGSGLLVMAAAELALQGLEAEQIVQKIHSMVPKVDASFVVDTLLYLYKGGRCSAVSALGANLLSLKPCIEVKNGKMGVGKKYRGSITKCLTDYVRDRLNNIDRIDPSRIFVTSTAVGDELPNLIAQQVRDYGYFKEILVTRAGSTIACHCGPNTLGILYMLK